MLCNARGAAMDLPQSAFRQSSSAAAMWPRSRLCSLRQLGAEISRPKTLTSLTQIALLGLEISLISDFALGACDI